MSVTREDLEADRLRCALSTTSLAPQLLTDAQVRASLEATLARKPGKDVWLFAYGSLMWNPQVHVVESRPATLYGFHRSFCLRSVANRGTVDRPGLVLALDRGGSCRGLALRLAATSVRDELLCVWRRELLTGAYTPRWLPLHLGDDAGSPVEAIAFVMNRDHWAYAGRLSDESILATLRTAQGAYGRNADYLIRTVAALNAIGVSGGRLHRLCRQL